MSSSFDQLVENLLTGLGLTDKEARLYRLLLQEGTLKPATLATKSGLKRGLTYNLLYGLEKRGLTARISKDGRTFFRAENPQKLLDLVENKKQETTTLEANLKQVLGELKSQYKLAVGKPTVRYFEGSQGIKDIFEDIYAPKPEPVLGACDVDLINRVFENFPEKELVPSRLKSKLAVKVFFNDTPLARKLQPKDKAENRESVLLDPEKYPLPADIEVYENKIALMSFRKGDFMGLIIENEDFAATLGSLLRFFFDHAPSCPSLRPARKKAK